MDRKTSKQAFFDLKQSQCLNLETKQPELFDLSAKPTTTFGPDGQIQYLKHKIKRIKYLIVIILVAMVLLASALVYVISKQPTKKIKRLLINANRKNSQPSPQEPQLHLESQPGSRQAQSFENTDDNSNLRVTTYFKQEATD